MDTSDILVLGATGKVGTHLVKNLQAKNASFTVFARDPAKAREKFGPDIQVATGDITDVASFTAAVTGKTRLFVLSHTQLLEPSLMRAAAEAGVKHIVKLSVVGASTGEPPGSIFHGHAISEKALLEIPNIAWTILRPHLFMQQNVFDQEHAFKGQGPYCTAHLEAYMATIDIRDIADVAATVLTEPIEKHAGITYVLTGPKAIKDREMIDIANKVLGRTIQVQEIDDVQAFEMFTEKLGFPRQLAFSLVNLSQFYRYHLCCPFHTGDVKIVTGKEARSYEQFFVDYKDQLSA